MSSVSPSPSPPRTYPGHAAAAATPRTGLGLLFTFHIYIKNAISIRNNPGMINAHLLDFCIRKNRMVPVFNLTG